VNWYVTFAGQEISHYIHADISLRIDWAMTNFCYPFALALAIMTKSPRKKTAKEQVSLMNMHDSFLFNHIPRLRGIQESLLTVLNAQTIPSEVNVHIRPRAGNFFWSRLLVQYVISFRQKPFL
jgi:hypothetical protein